VQELGENIARQIAKLVKRNIPYHKRHAQFMNRVGQGGRRLSALFDCCEFFNWLLAGSLNLFLGV